MELGSESFGSCDTGCRDLQSSLSVRLHIVEAVFKALLEGIPFSSCFEVTLTLTYMII